MIPKWKRPATNEARYRSNPAARSKMSCVPEKGGPFLHVPLRSWLWQRDTHSKALNDTVASNENLRNKTFQKFFSPPGTSLFSFDKTRSRIVAKSVTTDQRPSDEGHKHSSLGDGKRLFIKTQLPNSKKRSVYSTQIKLHSNRCRQHSDLAR